MGHVAYMLDIRDAYNNLDENPKVRDYQAGSREHSNQPLGFIKGGDFLEQVSDY